MKKIKAVSFVMWLCLSMCACGKKEKQQMYFDATEFVAMTESEVIEKLGESDSIEDWLYNDKYIMRTYTYGSREFTFVQDTMGVYQLARITLYEDIPYTDKNTIYELFNLKKDYERL